MMEQSLVSAPWVEHFQSGCSEAEVTQLLLQTADPKTPLEHYRRVRHLFASPGSGELLKMALSSPWSSQFLPTQLLKQWDASPTAPPLFPVQLPSGAAPLYQGGFPRIAECCQLALLWSLYARKRGMAAFQLAAEKLAGWLLPLIESRLTTLWTIESQYDERETALSCALLLMACGKEADQFYREDLPKDPFFRFLFQSEPKIEVREKALAEPLLGYRLIQSADSLLALSLCGKGTAAGAMRIGSLVIPAFGPQGAPLSDSTLFGVDTTLSDRGWFRPAASSETWFQMQPKVEAQGISISWQQIGMDPKKPIALSFYLSADTAILNNKHFKPKSLQKFSGESNRADFEVGGLTVAFVFDRALRMELIPLAGEGCFWGTSFLFALWLPPFDGTLSFQIRPVAK